MKIGGLVKNSFIDFPGTLACVVFTQGCNFRCPYCHNPALVPFSGQKDGNVPEMQKVFSFLEKRKEMIQGVVITGGEPTLQEDLVLFCRRLKRMGYKVKLDTNGSRPEILSALFERNLIDFISMDIKTSIENYPAFSARESLDILNVEKSIELIRENIPLHEFRTTCTKFFIDRGIMENIGKMIRGAPLYTLRQCSRKVKVLDQNFLKQDDNFFSDGQIYELKKIIDPYVKKSFICNTGRGI